MANLIYLSPSNHGKNTNKCLLKGCYEDKHTRPVAQVCAKYLKEAGFDVIVAGENQTLAARCKESDAKGAVLHVPIHTNASSSPSARYLLFMFYNDTAAYRKIFEAVAPPLEAIYPGAIKAQFKKRTNLYEINYPKAKTVYCELGFHTNQTDCDDFIHDSEAVGKVLAQGICNYFGVSLKGNNPPTTEPAGLSKGAEVRLSGTKLYSNSTTKVPAARVTGTYYLWDNRIVKGRVRITNSKTRVGLKGQITGWIDADDF